MNQEQVTIFVILGLTVGMFLWGKWRHDMVAMAALLACVGSGVLDSREAFSGFGHPAVVTVACVLILSRALALTGAVDQLTRRLLPGGDSFFRAMVALTGLAALLSAFMNNVGALALLMPVATQLSQKHGWPPGRLLMPLAFGSILGGMTTMIGTPPNLIVAGFRAEVVGESFGMFSFTPVGLSVALAGLAFLILVGWRLVPLRERAGVVEFRTGSYITEVRLPAKSRSIGKTLRDLGPLLREADATVVGLVRGDLRMGLPHSGLALREGDILLFEAEPKNLAGLLDAADLMLEESDESTRDKAEAAAEEEEQTAAEIEPEAPPTKEENLPAAREMDDVTLMELAVRPDTEIEGRSATELELRTRFGVNLLALSRRGVRSIKRLRSERIRAGDVLLMQGAADAIRGFANEFGCIPLAERSIRMPDRRAALLSVIIMLMAVVGAAMGLVPAAISFAAGVLALMAFRVLPPRSVFEAVDWPVIVLLGALIPVAGVMDSSGGAGLLADFLISVLADGRPVLALALILIVTMTLSDFMNNAATAAVMCPVAIETSLQLSKSPDAFLMAVGIGASCAFLTPIGHQNNTLILGPGGFRFGDYWRLGLPLEILVCAVSIPTLLWFWPL